MSSKNGKAQLLQNGVSHISVLMCALYNMEEHFTKKNHAKNFNNKYTYCSGVKRNHLMRIEEACSCRAISGPYSKVALSLCRIQPFYLLPKCGCGSLNTMHAALTFIKMVLVSFKQLVQLQVKIIG